MNNARRLIARSTAFAGALLMPALALAHPGHEADASMIGPSHPWFGIDHLLALIGSGMLRAFGLLMCLLAVRAAVGQLRSLSSRTRPTDS